MAVYSILLGAGRVLESDSHDIYTAPGVGVVVVRDVVIASAGGGLGPVGVDVLSGSVLTPIFHATMGDTVTTYHWSGRQVLLAGDVVRVTTYDGQCYYRVSGYLLGV